MYASPLRRACETASAVPEPHGLSVELVQDLIEVDVGQWEGQSWKDIERTAPEAYRAFMADPCRHPYMGGETIENGRARVVPAFELLMQQSCGLRIAVVAHNVVNRVYLAYVLGMPVARYRSVPQNNCGVSLIRYEDGKPRVVTVNAVFHLNGPFAGGSRELPSTMNHDREGWPENSVEVGGGILLR